MSINDTISRLIDESEGVARELTWFLKGLPAACALEGREDEAIETFPPALNSGDIAST